MKFAVVVFPGSNCDHDAYHAVKHVLGADAEFVWHKEADLKGADVVILPGGFSYGDYLRTGAIARFSPIMAPVVAFAEAGGPVLGVCNGFQVLVKMGLLPGDEGVSLTQTASLALNDSGQYENRWATLEFDPSSPCVWTRGLERMRVPVRHGEGKFVTDDESLLDRWAESGQLVARYVDPESDYPGASDEILPYPVSPNQSWRNIAGVCDPTGLVFGLMPHPEANHSTWLGASWTREQTDHGEGEGMAIFHNAVRHVLS